MRFLMQIIIKRPLRSATRLRRVGRYLLNPQLRQRPPYLHRGALVYLAARHWRVEVVAAAVRVERAEQPLPGNRLSDPPLCQYEARLPARPRSIPKSWPSPAAGNSHRPGSGESSPPLTAVSSRGRSARFLRREGIYCSQLATWRKNRATAAGRIARQRGRQADPALAEASRTAKLTCENERLRRQLTQARMIIDVQKKFQP